MMLKKGQTDDRILEFVLQGRGKEKVLRVFAEVGAIEQTMCLHRSLSDIR